ncbi:hypothetical protein Ccrd_011561 [Cynara cardunculus var. scolymus]|uniref:Uncharacterized protein n=1 Tax=Cynara cardunculus var. scolymus TaxID=59895 RepID=A0A103YJ75_CYNCS|nr:hypothetical protein Ccrd_011561 [Cynara cardunculus var. scolymus]
MRQVYGVATEKRKCHLDP